MPKDLLGPMGLLSLLVLSSSTLLGVADDYNFREPKSELENQSSFVSVARSADPAGPQAAATTATSAASTSKSVPEDEAVPLSYWDNVQKELARADSSSNPFEANRKTQPIKSVPLRAILDPWRDHQPYQTALGNAILQDADYLRVGLPTLTPPPTQAYVDQFAWMNCPTVLLPSRVRVQAPLCGESSALWTNPQNSLAQILKWESIGCGEVTLTETTGASNDTTVIGTLRDRNGFYGQTFDYVDCKGSSLFTIEERVFKQPVVEKWMQADENSAKHVRYYIKYIVTSPRGNTLVETDIFHPDSDSFNWHLGDGDLGGKKETHSDAWRSYSTVIASTKREGQWEAGSCWDSSNAPLPSKDWSIHFNDTGAQSNLTEDIQRRLAVTSALTVFAIRNEDRKYGLVPRDISCVLASNAGAFVLSAFLLLGLVGAISLAFYHRGTGIALVFCFRLEECLLPRYSLNPQKLRKI